MSREIGGTITTYLEKLKIYPYLTPHTKINFKVLDVENQILKAFIKEINKCVYIIRVDEEFLNKIHIKKHKTHKKGLIYLAISEPMASSSIKWQYFLLSVCFIIMMIK